MKTLFLWICLLLGISLQAQTIKTVTIQVSGNCEDCKDRIENAADIKGVKLCTWDTKTKVAKITFDSSKTSMQTIQLAIAKAGYDTPESKAPQSAYNQLPKCCRYRDGKCEK